MYMGNGEQPIDPELLKKIEAKGLVDKTTDETRARRIAAEERSSDALARLNNLRKPR